jgi:predicted DNA-binding transcriptional regulator YafY
MPYGRSLGIAERHKALLTLIEARTGSAARLAEALGVSEATVNRDVGYLRTQGHAIRSLRVPTGWIFELAKSEVDPSSAGAVR